MFYVAIQAGLVQKVAIRNAYAAGGGATPGFSSMTALGAQSTGAGLGGLVPSTLTQPRQHRLGDIIFEPAHDNAQPGEAQVHHVFVITELDPVDFRRHKVSHLCT